MQREYNPYKKRNLLLRGGTLRKFSVSKGR